MKQAIIILLCIQGLFSSLYASETGSITGNIIDMNTEALPYASVVLKNINTDTTSGTMSDDNGYFYFNNIQPGSYQISVSYMGLTSYQSAIITLRKGERIEIKDITLQASKNILSEVVIQGSNTISVIKPTYVKYKVSSLISQTGGNAGDILKNMPSIAMDGSLGQNRNIKYRGLGSAYTKVLINGKDTGLRGKNRESIIDQIPASSIKYIEILSVPGVEYQSEGINGIVNIVLKENLTYGTNGNVQVMVGNGHGLSGGFGISHKTEKLTVFGNYDYQEKDLIKIEEKLKTSFKDGAISGYERKIEKEDRHSLNQTFRTGFDYLLLPRTKLSATYIYGSQQEGRAKVNGMQESDSDRNFEEGAEEIKTRKQPSDYQQVLASIQHSFKNNTQLSTDFSYMKSNQDKNELKTTHKVDKDGRWLDLTPKVEDKNELNERSTYTWSLGIKELKIGAQNIQLGYTGISETSDFKASKSKFNYKDLSWSVGADGKDNFTLKETTQALYASDEFTYSFLRINAGIRYEFTQVTSLTTDQNNQVKANYAIVLPNISFTANIDKTQYLTFNFGRRIRRPGFKDLNPYLEEKEIDFFKTGNPDLMPEKAWAYEIGYLKNFKHFNIGANLFYRDINDVIQKTLTEDTQGIITEKPLNTGHAWTKGIEFMTSISALDFWQLNASYSIFKSKITSGEYKGDALKDQYKWSAKAINDFKLPYNTQLQLSLNAVGPKKTKIESEKTMWFSDLGIEKSIGNGASLMLRVTDIFDTLSNDKTKYTDKSTTYEHESTLGRVFLAGVKYSF
ncbi:MAG: TonB-dependent receptor [Flavobacteriaceae bacterium]|nr:TonB-dependent receptor [Flavobacteriaceae bacterium]